MTEPGFSASMGNFKGVMLCNRPAQVSGSMQSSKPPHSVAGSSSGQGAGSGVVQHSHASEMNTKPYTRDPTGLDRPAFVGSVAPVVPTGLRPLRKAFPKSANAKSVRDSVTWRHKQWLEQFTSQRNDALAQVHDDLLREQSKRARIAEKAAAQRAAVRSVPNTTVGTPLSPSNAAVEEERRRLQDGIARATAEAAAAQVMTVHAPAPPKAAQSSGAPSVVAFDGSASVPATSQTARDGSPRKAKNKAKALAAAGGGGDKPVWARTAKENDDLEDAEMDGLLQFANGLSFDSYMKDMEVREAVRAMKNRVSQIESEQQQQTAREAAEREAAERTERDAKLQALNMKLGGSTAPDGDDEWEEYEEEELVPAASLTIDAAAGTAAPAGSAGAGSAAAAAPAMVRRMVKRRRRKAKRPATAAAGAAADGSKRDDAPHYSDAALGSSRAAAAAQQQQQHGVSTQVLVDRVLHSSHAMRGIHSAASVRAMIDKASAQLTATAAGNGTATHAGASGSAAFGPGDTGFGGPASTLPPLPPSPTNINPTTMTQAQLAATSAAHAAQPALPSLAIKPPLVTVNRAPSLVRPENGLNPSLLPFLRRHPVV